MYCEKCGLQLSGNSKFCKNCGNPQNGSMNRDFKSQKKSTSVFQKIVLFLLAICVIFMLVQSILLKNFGVTVNAEIYSVVQKEYINSSDKEELSDPTRFELSYRYTVDGKTYESKGTMYFQYGYVVEVEADGKSIPKTAVVRYFPPIPSWSEIVSVQGGKHGSHLTGTPFGWIVVVIFVLMLVIMLIRNRRIRKRMKSER